jgi:Ca2+-binding EF-hand superfamily protein
MVAEANGPLNFPAFVKLFENKLNGTDDESKLLEAFKVFDMSGSGKLSKDA